MPSTQALGRLLTIAWLIVFSIVGWKLADFITAAFRKIRLLHPSGMMLGLLLGGTFMLFLAWVMWDYFRANHRSLRLPTVFVLTFLPTMGKYVPGRIWAVGSYLYHAKELGNISVFDASFFQVYITATSTLASVALAVLGLWVLVAFPVDEDVVIGAGLTIIACVLTLLACWRYFREQRSKLKRLPLHLALLAMQKLARGGALAIFVGAFLDSTVQLPLLIFAFIVATQVGILAFFAPAGLGVQEGAYVAILAPSLGFEQAASIALLARIWQVTIDFALASIALTLKASLTNGITAVAEGEK
ncbi:MAG: hypothetical protein EXR86_00935 [Gammaproteobacteria bacterium]|nr:hypothetical protein [Gammaproteobacteria bacterium]